MFTRLVLLVATVAAAVGGGAGVARVGGGAAVAGTTWIPPDDTITRITGTRHDGFHVEYHRRRDGFLPTWSEAIAECGEYAERIDRVRCRVRVRTWYRTLGATKRAIRLALQS